MTEKTETFEVKDMHCDSCVNTISTTLSNNENITDVCCDLDKKEVSVTFDDEAVDVEEILGTLDMIGFPATIKKKP